MQIQGTTTLSAYHRKELEAESAIDPAVIAERGYITIERPDTNENFSFRMPGGRHMGGAGINSREFLSRLGFPSWATRENYFYPGLWIPNYAPDGSLTAGQWKPRNPVPNRDGKKMKYASARGGATTLDVHPRWTRDRGQEDPALLPWIQTTDRRLWITEGVKKADSLTSRDEVTIALSGVFNWRNQHGTLGAWEDVPLKGREVVLCFDADTVAKPMVAQAMQRLGKWLVHKKVKSVTYCVVPAEFENVTGIKGVDDFFAAGGSIKYLEQHAFSKKPPKVTATEDKFTDARLAETLAVEVLDGAFCWAAGLDWLAWDGRVWKEVHEVSVIEAVRQWVLEKFADAAARLRDQNEGDAAGDVDGWRSLLSANRAKTVLSLARGIVEKRAEEFDADPDLLNTPGGIVHLPTKEILPHDPDLLITKITNGSYRPGYTHPDWLRALTILPENVAAWMQIRIGQSITGHTTPDGIVLFLQGGGENGKSLMSTDGLLPALGGYGAAASPKLFANSGREHSTERAELRGQRLVIAEELTEGRSVDVTSLKQVADVTRITARRTHKDNMSFDASHTILVTTNYIPVISETDHGTWRRLALVKFPFTFVKPGKPIENPETERRGDPTLKQRIKDGKNGQHDAAVTWAVEGAFAWYENMRAIEAGDGEVVSVMLPPKQVEEDTFAWRMDADRILGFWSEMLIPDPAAIVLAADVTEMFNEWLTTGGHSPWAKETFRPRFAEHAETKRHRAAFKRKARLATLAAHVHRKPAPAGSFGPAKALPAQADAWQGFRFRLDADGM
jgi:P4 family phage/plasmid primase-like protien